MGLTSSQCCGEQEKESGWGYQCTQIGHHTEHMAHGLDEEILYRWPVADDASEFSRVPREWKAIDPDTTTLGKPVDDFQVKIWYASGVPEVVSHIDFVNAGTIYSEAVGNPRVVAAEVHCPGGCLAASFRREVPVSVVMPAGTCGRIFTEDAGKTCGRVPGHRGLHRDSVLSPTKHWGDNECEPLDTAGERG